MSQDILWAPWRLEFIKGEKPKGCIFCTLPQAGDDPNSLILWRGTHCYVIMNKFPYNNGHLMVVPFAHVAELEDMRSEQQTELIWATGECVHICKATLGAHAANCGMNLGQNAGAGILDHVHMHVVPRWQGDHNFMPVIAGTTCMPEYLNKTYDVLRPAFVNLKHT